LRPEAPPSRQVLQRDGNPVLAERLAPVKTNPPWFPAVGFAFFGLPMGASSLHNAEATNTSFGLSFFPPLASRPVFAVNRVFTQVCFVVCENCAFPLQRQFVFSPQECRCWRFFSELPLPFELWPAFSFRGFLASLGSLFRLVTGATSIRIPSAYYHAFLSPFPSFASCSSWLGPSFCYCFPPFVILFFDFSVPIFSLLLSCVPCTCLFPAQHQRPGSCGLTGPPTPLFFFFFFFFCRVSWYGPLRLFRFLDHSLKDRTTRRLSLLDLACFPFPLV